MYVFCSAISRPQTRGAIVTGGQTCVLPILSGANPVRLIFRDQPGWGTSSYLVLQAGDFDCYGGCRVKVKVDDAEPKSMSALRPDTDEATAMFINDEHGLGGVLDGATQVSVGVGRAHVCTPVTKEPLRCRLPLEKKNT